MLVGGNRKWERALAEALTIYSEHCASANVILPSFFYSVEKNQMTLTKIKEILHSKISLAEFFQLYFIKVLSKCSNFAFE